MIFLRLADILLTEQARGRVFLDLTAVGIKTDQTNDVKYRQTDRTEADAGEQRQSDDLLRHASGKCIHQAGGKSDRAAENGKSRAYHSVITQGKPDRDRQRVKGIGSLAISQNAEYNENRVKNADDRKFFASCLLQNQIDACAERTADFQQVNSAGTDKERAHDGCAIDKTGVNGFKIVHKPDGRLILYILKRVWVNYGNSRSILQPLVRAARNDVGKYHDEKHNKK